MYGNYYLDMWMEGEKENDQDCDEETRLEKTPRNCQAAELGRPWNKTEKNRGDNLMQ